MARGCTQCGECLNVCPVFRQYRLEEYAPRGKRTLMEPVVGGASGLSWQQIFSLARLCAGCGRCKKACARKLSTADLLADVRAKHPRWTQYFWELWIRYMGSFWPSVGFLSSLVPERLAPKILDSSLATARALTAGDAPHPWVRIKPDTTRPVDRAPIVIFAGCTARNIRPRWQERAEQLLRRWEYPLREASGFTCCGGTLHHAGQHAAMEEMRRINIATWRALGKPRFAVFCASCSHGLAAYAGSTLTGEEAQEWLRAITPLSSLLDGARVTGTGVKPTGYGYHQPCHWEQDADMPFLAGIMPGLDKGTALCCGMGGILKMTDPDLSFAMARTCLDGFAKPHSSILTGCSGCAIQLAGASGAGQAVHHWLDVVAPQY